MTELLEQALSRLRQRPAADQDMAAEAIFAIIDRGELDYRLTPEQVETVSRTLHGLEDGTVRIASQAEFDAKWRRFGV